MQIIRLEELEKKKKWISNNNFNAIVGNREQKFRDLYYVSADPSEP
jgi:hypothetical protein